MSRHIVSAALAAVVAVGSLSACGPAAPQLLDEVRVPADASTLQGAMELVRPGGIVIISPGVYEEQLLVDKADVTIRGEDRNATIIDGGGIRPYGIVATADGVRIENLTARRATFYGVLITGLHDESGPAARGSDSYDAWDPTAFPPLQRFLVDHVTAHNNGLYGIYAFNSQHGVIRDSYASGSADSGIYVGQCEQCDILVTGNVAERNAVGFENANASDSVVLTRNRFSGNRIGMTLLSSYQEAFAPQRGNTIVGNLIADNTASDAPAHAEGGFATGIGIAGGQDNLVERNRLAGNPQADVILRHTEDLAARGNRFVGNASESAVQLANLSAVRSPAVGNCWADVVSTLPTDLASALGSCADDGAAQPTADALTLLEVPRGVSFLKVAAPRDQPQLVRAPSYPKLPTAVSMPDLAAVPLPDASLLADRAGAR
ncbi:nitrous oxide reductase family maturation protein NosD [Salinibacterium sp. ZJ70]|uniref:right-handed parallel beta-helix repeat-containing protein n=1 Tax=Salinibacterium sp. ZJ70 TaxID=2708084 RepID=UPI00141D98EC|nr:right-handed parallel beta-helix repeat-containing protein [Salinibacterium sp. ZJ70]